jgi:hypothetical protein
MADDQTGQDGSIVPGAVGALAGAAGGGWAGYVRHRNNAIAEAEQSKPGALHKALLSHMRDEQQALNSAADTYIKPEREAHIFAAKVRAKIGLDGEAANAAADAAERAAGTHFDEKIAPDLRNNFLSDAKNIEKHTPVSRAYQAAKLESEQVLSRAGFGKRIADNIAETTREIKQGVTERVTDFTGSRQVNNALREARQHASQATDTLGAAKSAYTDLHHLREGLAKRTQGRALSAAETEFLNKEVLGTLEQTHLDAVARHVDVKHSLDLAGKLEKGAAEVAKHAPIKGKLGMIAGGAALGAVAVGTAAHMLMGRGSSHADRIRTQQAQIAGGPQIG